MVRLIDDRYQRQQAREIVYAVNEAYGLSQPPSWLGLILESIKNAVAKLRSWFGSQRLEPTRVSRSKKCAIRRYILLIMYQQPTLESQKSPVHPNRTPWTLSQGFYAVMGGFYVHVPLSEAEMFLPDGSNGSRFMTLRGIRRLLDQETDRENFPDTSKQDIQSKSKANGFGKALVCIQALWFVAQCLTRRM